MQHTRIAVAWPAGIIFVFKPKNNKKFQRVNATAMYAYVANESTLSATVICIGSNKQELLQAEYNPVPILKERKYIIKHVGNKRVARVNKSLCLVLYQLSPHSSAYLS